MKVGDLIVFAESVTGIITGFDTRDPSYGYAGELNVKVLLADSSCEEWVERDGLRVISESG